MSKKILLKIIEELKKDSPDLSYMRGVLETLADNLPDEHVGVSSGISFVPYVPQTDFAKNTSVDPEQAQFDLGTTARIKNVDMGSIQTEN